MKTPRSRAATQEGPRRSARVRNCNFGRGRDPTPGSPASSLTSGPGGARVQVRAVLARSAGGRTPSLARVPPAPHPDSSVAMATPAREHKNCDDDGGGTLLSRGLTREQLPMLTPPRGVDADASAAAATTFSDERLVLQLFPLLSIPGFQRRREVSLKSPLEQQCFQTEPRSELEPGAARRAGCRVRHAVCPVNASCVKFPLSIGFKTLEPGIVQVNVCIFTAEAIANWKERYFDKISRASDLD